jgi:hypothetical protein
MCLSQDAMIAIVKQSQDLSILDQLRDGEDDATMTRKDLLHLCAQRVLDNLHVILVLR